MESSDEILKLLREIRDNQRELLVMEQQRRERSERRYRDWKEAEEQRQKEIDEWLQGQKTARTMRSIFFTVFLLVLGIGGTLVALGWIN